MVNNSTNINKTYSYLLS